MWRVRPQMYSGSMGADGTNARHDYNRFRLAGIVEGVEKRLVDGNDWSGRSVAADRLGTGAPRRPQ